MLACDTAGFDIKSIFPALEKRLICRRKPTRTKEFLVCVTSRKPKKSLITIFPVMSATRRTIGCRHSLRKQLAEKEKILDFMGSEEMIANLFRISQMQSKSHLYCCIFASILSVAWGTLRRRSLGMSCLVSRQMP